MPLGKSRSERAYDFLVRQIAAMGQNVFRFEERRQMYLICFHAASIALWADSRNPPLYLNMTHNLIIKYDHV